MGKDISDCKFIFQTIIFIFFVLMNSRSRKQFRRLGSICRRSSPNGHHIIGAKSSLLPLILIINQRVGHRGSMMFLQFFHGWSSLGDSIQDRIHVFVIDIVQIQTHNHTTPSTGNKENLTVGDIFVIGIGVDRGDDQRKGSQTHVLHRDHHSVAQTN
jgi:hypothetical protein